MMRKNGFTIIETILYLGILSIIAGLFVGILSVTTRVHINKSVSSEVTSQANFTLRTIQRLVRESSLIEAASTADNPDTTIATEYAYLKLRMRDASLDPTCIALVKSGTATGIIRITQGPQPGFRNEFKCKEPTDPADDLITDRVYVPLTPVGLTFTKFTNYPYPGHDSVQIDLVLNSNDPKAPGQITKKLQSAVARVSAATFDSNLLPGASTLGIGDPNNRWENGLFQNLTVGPGYFQFEKYGAGAPSDAACNNDGLRGRLYIDTTNNRLYICNGSGRGWDYIILNE